MLHCLRARQVGFTLIEIMIVIAIIAILAGIAIPNIMQARAEAQLEACHQNVKTLAGAVAAFSVRHSIKDILNNNIWRARSGISKGDDGGYSMSNLWLFEEEGYITKGLCCPLVDKSSWMTSYYIAYYPEVFKEDDNLLTGWSVWCASYGAHYGGHKLNGRELIPSMDLESGSGVYDYEIGTY